MSNLADKPSYKNLFFQVAKFAGVGVFATGIHALIYIILVRAIDAQLANVGGYICALYFSYYGQSAWTFENQNTTSKKTLIRFLSASIFGFLMNAFWVFIVDKTLMIEPEWALIGIGLLTPALSFLIMKLWVFKK